MLLENSKVRVEFNDADGSLISLYNKELGTDLIRCKSACENFRLSIPLATDWTNIIIGKGHLAQLTRVSAESGEIYWENISVAGKIENIAVRASVRLEGDEFRSTISIINNSAHKIDYVWYPVLGGIERLGDDKKDDLYQPYFCGIIHKDIYGSDWIDENNRYWYTSREFKSIVYPKTTNMQYTFLANDERGLYLSSYDNVDFHTGFYFEHERANTPMTLSIVKARFIAPGENYASCDNVVAFYKGSWHVAAWKYKMWLESWMVRADRPSWVKNLDGWLAFQGHCGDMHIAHPYEQYPQWLDKARLAGLDTIHIHCGVHEEGIEGGYPYWTNYSQRMGGLPKLKEVIGKIHEMGGRVVTFTKDNKVNLGLPEYEEKFAKHAIKLRDGANPRVSYCVGTLDMLCSGAQLAVMCRGDKEWQEFILEQMEEISRVGFDGNMIDEWCSGLELCMSTEHGHEKPVDQISGQHELGKKIRTASKQENPEFLLAGEELSDVAYEYMDFSFSRGGVNQWWGRDPRFYEMFRMSIPKFQCTAEILENEYPHLNYAFACGYMLILCIDYYHGGPDAYPEFADYFKEVIRIREQVRDFFNDGEFRDVLDYEVAGGAKLTSFRLDKKELVVVYTESENCNARISFSRSAKSVIVRSPYMKDNCLKDMSVFEAEIPANRILTLEIEY